jgi:putative thiamine transport system substrate-binding protein
MSLLIADGELDLSISFSPGAASTAITNSNYPYARLCWISGTIGNASRGDSYNSGSAVAMVAANSLMSSTGGTGPRRPQYPRLWNRFEYGRFVRRDERAAFDALNPSNATRHPQN